MISIFYGLTSALSWGAADFTGGLATRRIGPYRAVLYGELLGLVFILLITLSVHDPLPDTRSWMYAMLGGALGTLGLILLYQALATGKMTIAAPVSALITAILPVIVAGFTESLPRLPTFLGFAFALAAIWLISAGGGGVAHILSRLSDLRLPLTAGIGFGLFFVFMNAASHTSTLWPIVAARSTGLLIMILFLLVRRDSWRVNRADWGIVTINGILDAGGNALFILAAQTGRLDISAVLGSLYPGATVMLASLILKERISRTQWLGILAALVAIVLFTL